MHFALSKGTQPSRLACLTTAGIERFRARARANRRAFSEHERRSYLTQYGSHTSAYFNLQSGVRYFDLPGVGFLSYFCYEGILGRQDMVFTSPVCADADLPGLVDAYLQARGGHPVFAGVDPGCARVLETRGYSVNQIGVEFNVPIQNFRVTGRSMKYLRTVQNFGDRGVEARELSWSEVDENEVARISQAWLGQKQIKGRELKLLSRPPEWEDAWGVRKFYCFVDGKMVGFVFFDPFFRDGKIIGYCANILRSVPDVQPRGVLDFAILEAIKQFRAEGAETLALGLAPCYDVQSQLNDRVVLRHVLQQLYQRGSSLYSFQELAFHKTRWRGEEQRIYGCIRGPRGIGDLRAAVVALRSMNVI